MNTYQTIPDLIKTYNQAESDIHEYFGFKELWRVYPIRDSTKYYWLINGDFIDFWESEEQAIEMEFEPYYQNLIIYSDSKQQIYQTKDFTAILEDTNTDGNKFFSIFCNEKQLFNDEHTY